MQPQCGTTFVIATGESPGFCKVKTTSIGFVSTTASVGTALSNARGISVDGVNRDRARRLAVAKQAATTAVAMATNRLFRHLVSGAISMSTFPCLCGLSGRGALPHAPLPRNSETQPYYGKNCRRFQQNRLTLAGACRFNLCDKILDRRLIGGDVQCLTAPL